ncbi:hypothetical protein [Roseobacter litoralis]|uniref:Uncharacterized protein n=1 Tax=Roseobacter litoralis (strain ATCC 49566 / DSM 6996 / JCM 21268 / NBRC 15278 / OCh 149) TaxID=391595 RepID=F7ZBR6_ROSLO|nr:hypothetical protein [Roseobacter litoralis]AEI93108.1 hypothetical protein RLO149_c011010 [Roseobacter litoralis Och 149]
MRIRRVSALEAADPCPLVFRVTALRADAASMPRLHGNLYMQHGFSAARASGAPNRFNVPFYLTTDSIWVGKDGASTLVKSLLAFVNQQVVTDLFNPVP